MYERVLIFSATAGAGHVRAGQALEQAFRAAGAAREVRHLDILEYTSVLFRKLYNQAYLQACKNAPTVLGWLYDRMDKPFQDHALAQAINKLNTQPFVKLLQTERPDLCVCTHFLPPEIITHLKLSQGLRCPMATVVTDLDVHALWLTRGCDCYFVALPEAAIHLQKLGIPAPDTSVSGIPIDPVFARHRDPADMRRKFGLRPERTTILVTTGGFGVFPVENLLAVLTDLQHPAQVVVICGKNEPLRRKLQAWADDLRSRQPTFHIVGYTTEMDQYMAAADILVGKPGGLTTSEALARGLVLCVVNPIPGQEERNSDHLLEQGAAIRCNNLPALAWKLDSLLDDPARLEAMRSSARRLARPHAAADIVAHLVEREHDLRRRPAARRPTTPFRRSFLRALARQRRAFGAPPRQRVRTA